MTLNVGHDVSFGNFKTGEEYGRKQGKLIARIMRLPFEFSVSGAVVIQH
jgi:hypothetical protein